MRRTKRKKRSNVFVVGKDSGMTPRIRDILPCDEYVGREMLYALNIYRAHTRAQLLRIKASKKSEERGSSEATRKDRFFLSFEHAREEKNKIVLYVGFSPLSWRSRERERS